MWSLLALLAILWNHGNCQVCVTDSLDLAFILDASTSVTEPNFRRMLQFVQNIVSELDIDSGATRVAILTFSTNTKIQYNLGEISNKAEFIDKLRAISYDYGSTNTADALVAMRTKVFSTSRDRPHVPNVAILITDGMSNINGQRTVTDAEEARAAGITIVGVGITLTDTSELDQIVSQPVEKYKYSVDEFDKLDEIAKLLLTMDCKEAPDIDRPDTSTDLYKEIGSNPADIVFLLDTSTSNDVDLYNKIRSFLVHFVESSSVESGAVRFAFVPYTNYPDVKFYLNKYSRKADIITAIKNATFNYGERNTADAFDLLRRQVFTEGNGDRPQVPNIVLMITTGTSDRNSYRTIQEAEALRFAGVGVFAIGIGLTNAREIEAMASRPTRENTFQLTSVDELEAFRDIIFAQIFTRAEQSFRSPVTGSEQLDLIFLLHFSNNMRKESLNLVLDFVQNLLEYADIDSGQVRVGISIYRKTATSLYNLDRFSTKGELMEGIKQITTQYKAKAANTAAGLDFLRTDVFVEKAGDRPNVPNAVIIITDANTNIDQADAITAAEALKAAGTAIFSIGIGLENPDELDALATSREFSLALTQASELNNKTQYIQERIVALRTQEDLPFPLPTITSPTFTKTAVTALDIQKARLPPALVENREEADVVLAFHCSKETKVKDFKKGLFTLFSELVSSADVDSGAVRFALVGYGQNASVIFGFNSYQRKKKLLKALKKVKPTYRSKESNALDLILKLKTEVFSGSEGDRTGVPNIMILVTDSPTTAPVTEIGKNAKVLKDMGISVFSIGVEKADPMEISAMASEPISKYSYSAGTYYEMLNSADLKDKLSKAYPVFEGIGSQTDVSTTKKPGKKTKSTGTPIKKTKGTVKPQMKTNTTSRAAVVQETTTVAYKTSVMKTDIPTNRTVFSGLVKVLETSPYKEAITVSVVRDAYTALPDTKEVITDGEHLLRNLTTKSLLSQNVAPPLSGSENADIVFALHLSDRANAREVRTVLNYLNSLISGSDVENGRVKIGLLTYNADAEIIFNINQYNSVPLIRNEVLRTESRTRSSNVDASAALAVGTQMLSFIYSGRSDAPKALIFVTDSVSTENTELIPFERFRVQSEQVNVFSVGIGLNGKEELEDLATAPENVLTVSRYSELPSTIDDLKRKIFAFRTRDEKAVPEPEKPESTKPEPPIRTLAPPRQEAMGITLVPRNHSFVNRMNSEPSQAIADGTFILGEMVNDCPPPRADIVFVLDGSTSVGADNFKKVIDFARKVVEFADIDSGEVRVGLMTYSDRTRIVFNLKDISSTNDLTEAMKKVIIPFGNTNTADALRDMRLSMFTVANGDRPGVPNYAVVITDGVSNINQRRTIEEAERAHRAGIRIFAIGINLQNLQELEGIASKPIEENRFTVDDFDKLLELRNDVFPSRCQGEEGESKTPATLRVMPVPSANMCGKKQLDIVFILDSSTSVGERNFEEMIRFTKNVISRVDIDSGGIRIGFMTYSSNVYIIFNLNSHRLKADVLKAVDNVEYRFGSTNTAGALRLVRTDMFTPENGDRNNADNWVILITDGISNINSARTIPEAELTRTNGIRIFTIGIGITETRELKSIASVPVEKNFAAVQRFEDLSNIQQMLFSSVCPAKCGSTKLDIIFVMDASTSVAERNFMKIKQFAKDIVELADVDNGMIRFGVVIYSTDVRVQFTLNQYSYQSQILNSIDQIPYLTGSTNTADALRSLWTDMFTEENGDRPDADNIAIVVTDGVSNINNQRTVPEAQRVKSRGIHIYAIGINLDDTREITAIASEPSSENLYAIENFDDLTDLKENLFTSMCREGHSAPEEPDIGAGPTKVTLGACGLAKVDLVIILDASTSVSEPNYKKMLAFCKDFLKDADIDSGSVRVGIVIYSTAVQIQFHLNRYSTKSALFAAIDKIPYIYGSTNTADGLNTMRTKMFTLINGDRPDVNNVAIIITDGISNINARRTIPEAEQARAAGIHIYAIGIGLSDTKELNAMASPPASENSFSVKEFDELAGLAEKIFSSVCPGTTTRLPPATTKTTTKARTTTLTTTTTPLTTPTTTTKLTPTAAPACGLAKVDLVIVLDASTSVTEPNYKKMLSFCKDFLKDADIDSGSVRVGIVIYSTDVQIQFHLNRHSTKAAVFQAIDKIPYIYGSTNTADGLKTMRTQMFTQANGDRPDVSNVALVMTDGISNINARRTIPEAELARTAGIHIYAIGIGLSDTKELDAIATPPARENSFAVQDFNELAGLAVRIFSSICPVVPTTPKPQEKTSSPAPVTTKRIPSTTTTLPTTKTTTMTTTRTTRITQSTTTIASTRAKSLVACDLAKVDLVFILDASTSVTEANYKKMLTFCKDFLGNADIDSGSVRVGVVIYSTDVAIQFHLNRYSKKTDVFVAIDKIPYIYGSTNTADGLKTMRTVMFTVANGDRPDADNVAIVITDGISNINARRTVPEAVQARAMGIHIYAIGIGLSDSKELDAIASEPAKENSFSIQEFDELVGLENKIFSSICLGRGTAPPTSKHPTTTTSKPPTTTSTTTTEATTPLTVEPETVPPPTMPPATPAPTTTSTTIRISTAKAGEALTEPPPPACADAQVDLVYILDASTSVTEANFKKMLDFCKQLLEDADIDNGNVQVGVVVYSSDVRIEFYLNRYKARSDVMDAIGRIKYTYGSTNTAGGLKTMREELFSFRNGDRPDVPNVAIILTDGVSNINAGRTIPEAELARAEGIHIYAIGIGLPDTRELDAIASHPASENSFSVRTFDELKAIKQKVFSSLCPGLTGKQRDAVTKRIGTDKTESSSIKVITTQKTLGETTRTTTMGRPSHIYRGNILWLNNVLSVDETCLYLHSSVNKGKPTTPKPTTPKPTTTTKATTATTKPTTPKPTPSTTKPTTTKITTPKPATPKPTPTTTKSTTKATTPRPTTITTRKTTTTPRRDGYDLVMVLDSSVNSSTFNWMMDVTKDTIRELNIDDEEWRVGIVTYSTNPNREFNLNQYKNKADVLRQVDRIGYRPGQTNTASALKYVRTNMFRESNGDRNFAKNYVILITGNEKSLDMYAAAEESYQMQRDGVATYVIGLGINDKTELDELASLPLADYEVIIPAPNQIGETPGEVIYNLRSRSPTPNPPPRRPPRPRTTLGPVLPPEDLVCKSTGDIVFILDSSGSVGLENFYRVLNFTYNTIHQLDIESGNYRVGLVTFSDSARIEFYLNTYRKRGEIEPALQKVRYVYGSTHTAAALRRVRQELFRAEAGDRPDIPNVVVIVTDGNSNVNHEMTLVEADLLKRAGVSLITVAVGFQRETRELVGLTSAPVEENLIYADDYRSLDKLSRKLLEPLCTDSDLCRTTSPCKNDAVCVDGIRSYMCLCPESYYGTNCEKQCSEPADVAFILDSSNTVGESSFQRMKDYVGSLITEMNVEACNINVGLMKYSSAPMIQWGLGTHRDTDANIRAVNQVHYTRGVANMAAALKSLRTDIFNGRGGDRPKAKNIAYLLTDGSNKVHEEETQKNAELAISSGIRIIPVGVSLRDREDVDLIAGAQDLNTIILDETLGEINEAALAPMVRATDYCAGNPCKNGGKCLNESFGFTCECPAGFTGEDCTRRCSAGGDVVFAVDTSRYVTRKEMKRVRRFLRSVVKRLRFKEFKTGLVQYSNTANVVLTFADGDKKKNVLTAIAGLRNMVGDPDPAEALAKANFRIFKGDGAMADQPDYLVLLSKGLKNDEELLTQSNRLKMRGTRILGVGVALTGSERELMESVVSYPSSNTAYYADDVEGLDDVADKVVEFMCNGQDKCAQNPCQNKGKCQVIGAEYYCDCPHGFAGKNCELKCDAKADIVFLLDSSGSVGHVDFRKVKDFAYRMIDDLNIGKDQTRVGLVAYSSRSRHGFYLKDYYEKYQLQNAISSIEFEYGKTNTADGLRHVREKLFNSAVGDRPDAQNFVVVITDGLSNIKSEQTIVEADLMKSNGVHVYAIGIGKFDRYEIDRIASEPASKNAFILEDYASLASISSDIIRATCKDPSVCDENPCRNDGRCEPTMNGPICKCTGGYRGTYCEMSCVSRKDIIFVLDSSSSVGEENFELALEFVSSVVEELSRGGSDNRYAMITFSNDVQLVFSLGRYSSAGIILNAIKYTRYRPGSTNTAAGLRTALEISSPDYGDRKDVDNIVILVADGQSNVNTQDTIPAADDVKKTGAKIITIGVGLSNYKELETIGSGSENVYKVNTYNLLVDVKADILENSCSENK